MRGERPVGAGTLTWEEVLHSDAMAGTRVPVQVGLEQEVVGVRLVSDVEQVRTCRLGTLVVLDGPVASAVWAVEVAIRFAWERHLPGVIARLEEGSAESVVRLAERLDVSVGFHDGDLADFALQLSSLVSYPEAVRSRLVVRCASSLARQTTSDGVLRTLNHELPDATVALLDETGRVVAGPELSRMSGPRVVRVELDPFDVKRGRALVGVTGRHSSASSDTLRTVLEIARSHLVACEAPRRAVLLDQSAYERWALERLLVAPEPAEPGSAALATTASPPVDDGPARELGWPLRGPLVGVVVLPRAELSAAQHGSVTAALRGIWPGAQTGMKPVEHGEGWALWQHLSDVAAHDPGERAENLAAATAAYAARVEKILRRRGATLDLCGGLGRPVDSVQKLHQTLRQASLAASAHRDGVPGTLTPFSRLTLVDHIGASASSQLAAVAKETLSSLLEHDEAPQLLVTLGAYLDCGGSSSRTAERLGVHRNTVSARLDRVRAAGVDVDDPDRRLVIHLAAHLLARGS